MEDILKRARNLELNEYPRDHRDCIKQGMSEFNDDVRDAVNVFDITYDEFFDNCVDCYNSMKKEEIRNRWC